MFGLVVSIPLVIAGSQVIMKLIERFPFLILAGGGLLGWVAGEMIVEDVALAPWIDANAPRALMGRAARWHRARDRRREMAAATACARMNASGGAHEPDVSTRLSRAAAGMPLHFQG